MEEDVARFIRGFILCFTNNPNNIKQGLYHPFPVPTRPLDNISVDFVGGFPTTSKGHDYKFVVVDRFKNICIHMLCKKTIKGHEAVGMFFEQVWVHFGIPKSIISNRDTIFLSAILDYTLGEYGHQVQEIYNFPSTDRWVDKSSQQDTGSTFEGL
jgi:hypothetical protein